MIIRLFSCAIIACLIGCASTSDTRSTAGPNTSGGLIQSVESNASREPDSATQLSNAIIKHIHKLPNKRVTVADFTDIDGNDTEEGKLLAEQILNRLLRVESLIVIERKQLNKILKEQQLSLTGITQEEEYKLGKVLNVDAIISGTIAHLDDYEEINARMIDVISGRIYCAANHKTKLDQREKEIAALPEEQRNRVNREFETRREEKRRNPVLHKLIQKHKKQMAYYRRVDPQKFNRMVRIIKQLNRIRKNDPRLYILLTEPSNSRLLKKVKRRNPNHFRVAMKLRRKLEYVIMNSSNFQDIVSFQRHKLLKQERRRRG